MTDTMVIELAKNAVQVMVTIAAPILLVGLVVGVFVSVMQAVTSIQDATLAYVPKMAIMLVTLFFLSGWVLNLLVSYTRNLLSDFTPYIR